MHPSVRLTRLLAVVALGAVLAVGATAPHPAAAAPGPPATAALDWLAAELAANDHVLTSFGLPDYGLTLDAVLALALGDAHDDVVQDTMTVIEDDLDQFFTDAAFGTGTGRFTGALAKSALAVAVTGGDLTSSDGRDLEQELRGLVATSGPDAGRFVETGDFAGPTNGFAQALGIQALSHTEAGAPAAAVAFLVDQQCPGGGFRGVYEPSGGCTADPSADPDYTAIALAALLTAPDQPGVPAAVTRAVTWLTARQLPSGGFANAFGDVNSNTAGLAGNALRAAGSTAAADATASFVTSVQLTAAEDATDAGAIAFTAGAHAAAAATGIDDLSRDQFRRATAQAVLALGLPPYGAVPAPVPGSTTTTAPGATTTTSTPGGSTTTTAPDGTSSTTIAAAPSTTDPTAAGGTGGGLLARTGTAARDVLALALVLLGAGLVVRGATTARRPGAP